MIVTIFGATGMIGRQLVKHALHEDYKVRAFGRNVFTAGFPEHNNLELMPGALFDKNEVMDAIKGSDAVLSAIGGPLNGTDKARSLGIKNIIAQMEAASLKRIIAVGGYAILNYKDNELIIDSPNYPAQLVAMGQEHYKAYEYLNASSLNWTDVCPSEIIDADVTGSFHTSANYPPQPDTGKINSGDLAMFIINELKKNEYIKQRVGISN
jgi:hypothetical protein